MSPVELLKYRTLLCTIIIDSFFCDFIKVLPSFYAPDSSDPSLIEIHRRILLKSIIKNLSLYVFICELNGEELYFVHSKLPSSKFKA